MRPQGEGLSRGGEEQQVVVVPHGQHLVQVVVVPQPGPSLACAPPGLHAQRHLAIGTWAVKAVQQYSAESASGKVCAGSGELAGALGQCRRQRPSRLLQWTGKTLAHEAKLSEGMTSRDKGH